MTGVEAYQARKNFINGEIFQWRNQWWKFEEYPIEYNISAGEINTVNDPNDVIENKWSSLAVKSIHIDGINVTGYIEREKPQTLVGLLLYIFKSKMIYVEDFVKLSEMRGL